MTTNENHMSDGNERDEQPAVVEPSDPGTASHHITVGQSKSHRVKTTVEFYREKFVDAGRTVIDPKSDELESATSFGVEGVEDE